MRSRWATLAVVAWLCGAPEAWSVGEIDPNADPRLERAVELQRRLGELSRELEKLLSGLTPEQRAEFERRVQGEQEPGAQPEPIATQESAPIPADGSGVVQVVKSPAPPQAATGPRCGTLDVLDSNADGVISGADRHWRYLSLWRDDGDGEVESSELRSLFRHGIRRLSARLYSYTTAGDTDGGVWVEEAIYLDLPGRRRAALAINAGGLARGRELWLEDAAGTRLEGFQVLRAGLVWVAAEGRRTDVLCERQDVR